MSSFKIGPRSERSPWNDAAPIREELFGIERLEQHAESLAAAQSITEQPQRVLSLHRRLDDNAAVLLTAYRASAVELERGGEVVPAAEWLLDNYHLVEEQIREIREDLPAGFYRQLPKLAAGPFAGYPRVFGLAWGFVAHTDSHFDPDILGRFMIAYQRVQPLTIGELWAVAITLRIVLIENLRRLSDQITAALRERAKADALSDTLLAQGSGHPAMDAELLAGVPRPLSELFAAQLAKRLRDQDPRTTPALWWIEEQLGLQQMTIDSVVRTVQQRQGASNLTVRNIITSMRLISAMDWSLWFEQVSLIDAMLLPQSAFASMDFATRNLYRDAIEQLARGSGRTELAVAEAVLGAAQAAIAGVDDASEVERVGDPGYHLIGNGRDAFERSIGFKPPLRLRMRRFVVARGIVGYVGASLALSALLVAAACWSLVGAGTTPAWLLAFALAAFLPATELATALVNRVVAWNFGAQRLPALELKSGVPRTLRTLVAVPTLLGSESEVLEHVERLEIHYLAGGVGDLTFALLSDGVDADTENTDEGQRLLVIAITAVTQLNLRHGPGVAGPRFLLLHRRRRFNASEGRWMGWERKRGKLHELNRLLRGATDTSFMALPDGLSNVPDDVRYVITLDADTQLPRDTALRLVGKMAHPLNRPRMDVEGRRVIEGYGILQPRVTPSLPVGGNGSLHQQVFSSPGGMDPYAAAVSDVYQDLFGEGSYTGKGIYDVDAFEAALNGRAPENALLSHDLFEGIFARSGLASDVEVVEEFPIRYDVAAKRSHRWVRGDWQLLPWLIGRAKGAAKIPPIGRGKMLDNLRRSLIAPCYLVSFALCMLLPVEIGRKAMLLLAAAIAIPPFLPAMTSFLSPRPGVNLRHHLGVMLTDVRLAALQTLLALAFIPDQAWRMGDAILRTLGRLFISHRHLLEWTTAAKSARSPQPGLRGFFRQMAGGTLLTLTVAAAALLWLPSAWPLVVPMLLLWLLAPPLANWISQPREAPNHVALNQAQSDGLRLIARRTWRYFETFVSADEHMLPPDNFQETPHPVVARRTSPTNIGLYLLSAVCARDFGWAGTLQTIERIEATFETLRKLARCRGHFFNWYGTADLQVLTPAYVSSVDSGNFAGHLIALANACEEWIDAPLGSQVRAGLGDALQLARMHLDAVEIRGARANEVTALLGEIDALLRGSMALETMAPNLARLAEKAARLATALSPVADAEAASDLVFWLQALRGAVLEHARDRQRSAEELEVFKLRLQAIADEARAMAMAMDFRFLIDPERMLLSIGYSQVDNRLDPSCYDLLASEARLASLFAIAKGDVPSKHWFRLGRTATPVGNGSALISWSGSMFEYLMPSLVMRAPTGSLLEQTTRLAVARQQSYGREQDVPWGISESAYNARDYEFTYQYSNFGVPGLGLKRGLSENLVIAPYATGLASMVDARAAFRNYERLEGMDALGRHGFYEALDFTRSHLPDDEVVAIVRNFMAHHQGMTIVAIANTLRDGQMRARFHREPMIQASELLLQERTPRNVVITHPRAEEVHVAAAEHGATAPEIRRIPLPAPGPPITHLLSNGRYAVMLTAAGSGYSRWRDIAITRWREDATRDADGAFVFLRDVDSTALWTAGTQPIASAPGFAEVVFSEDRATWSRGEGSIVTALEVLVSGEDDGEVRRISLTNSGRRSREIQLTSYAELVLTSPATDNAHPAFAKMFVQTEYLPEFGALIATRRPRSASETPVWVAHFAVIEGESVADPQYESDRARFIGRGGSLDNALAMKLGQALSNTVGTVLDPVFSLRHRVLVAPGSVTRVAYWTLAAATREQLLGLIDKHHDRNAFDRASTLAWTQAQVQLRHFDMDSKDAADFQRLAAPLLYANPAFRASSEAIIRGAGPQSGLWQHSISGDLPIALMRIDDIEDIAQVRQLLRAQEYWRSKRLAIDVVIVNEHASSYLQDLQIAIESAVRSSQARPRRGEEFSSGVAYALRADLLSMESRTLLQSVARVVLIARRGLIAEQLAAHASTQESAPIPMTAKRLPATLRPPAPASSSDTAKLEFFNGIGGFDEDGKQYVTILEGGSTTPAPWINVIANPQFGFQVSAAGSSYSWAENSRENQLTPWSNDPVCDPGGEAFYVRDDDSMELFSVTAQVASDDGRYVARHGHGYSRFEHVAHGIEMSLLQYVPLADPIKISRLTLRNVSDTPRRLTITRYAEWVLGTSRSGSAAFLITEFDTVTGALLARNPWNIAFPGRVAFADMGGRANAWTADRTEFLGRRGSLRLPLALTSRTPLSGSSGAGRDPCAALQRTITLAAGESIEIVSFLGQCVSIEAVRELLDRYREADLDAVLDEVKAHWDVVLGSIRVRTPDRAMDIMLNGWLLYQTLACRIWARSGFYQASGAYGFRDQLQDGMALTFNQPDQTRHHLLRAAARQFVEGDVQHWWLPHSGQGVRTRISDDRVWLAYACARYIGVTEDKAVLDELVPFLEGPLLRPEEHDHFFQPMQADLSASLFEHCARGLDDCLRHTGALGLPLIGTGDWNDGMNRVGEEGRGESVWLGWLLLRTIEMFAPLAQGRGEAAEQRAERWTAHATGLRAAIEAQAWDGAWYRRATFDNGTWLGTKDSDACRIDSIAQSWAVLSGAADPARAAIAMASVEKYLILPDDGLALLFTPPFDDTELEPGYIKGYPPGLRENGGQYSHAAMWVIFAFAKLGEGDKANALFSLLNPIMHALDAAAADRYKVEPYVIAADVYSVAPHVGRGGWTWYTGSAGWMYRAGTEAILGIRREADVLIVDPCIPAQWPGFEATVTVASTRYRIEVKNPSARCRGITEVTIDGVPFALVNAGARLPLDGRDHAAVITM